MEKELNTKQAKELFEVISKLETPLEAKKFLRDLCTLKELTAKLIDQGVPYREIAKKTGSSTATITRVAHWLKHGHNGYRMMLDKT